MRAPLPKLLGASLLFGALLGGCAHRDVDMDPTDQIVAAEFSDANVAAVLSSINALEIETSRLALERSQNPNVRMFAQRMIRDHSALQDAQNQMLAARDMTARHNAASVKMTRNLEPTLAQLGRLSGADFDRAYIALQRSAHQDAINSIDRTLAPTTRDPGLRQFITQQVRPRLASHLQWIQEIDRVHVGS